MGGENYLNFIMIIVECYLRINQVKSWRRAQNINF